MLDQMSGGRLEIGFGRGASLIELAIYGEDPDAAQDIYTESLELILKGLDGEATRFPRQAFLVRRRADGARTVAEAASADLVRRPCTRQRRARGQAQPQCRQPRSARRHPAVDRTLSRHLAAAACRAPRCPSSASAASSLSPKRDAQALALARRAYPVWHQSFTYLFRLRGQPQNHPRPADFDALMERGQGVAGSPATVTEFLARQLAETQCNYVVGQFAFGDHDARGSACARSDLFVRRRHAGSCGRGEDAEALSAAR